MKKVLLFFMGLLLLSATALADAPSALELFYTPRQGETAVKIANGNTYSAINATTVSIKSLNATSIVINDVTSTVENGEYSFQADVDNTYSVYATNNDGNSETITFTIQVDYEANTIPQALELSRKQIDRTNADKRLYAPVKFTGWVFITGHYVRYFSETLHIVDAYGNHSMLYDNEEWGGSFTDKWNFRQPLQRGTQFCNFTLRSCNNLPGEGLLISWPQDADDVQSYSLESFDPIHDVTAIHEDDAYKLVKVKGDLKFETFYIDNTYPGTSDPVKTPYPGAVITLADGSKMGVLNGFNIYGPPSNAPEQPVRTQTSDFDWMPGDAWPEDGTEITNVYVAGFVLPFHEHYIIFAAQASDKEGAITGVDGVENDSDNNISVNNGVITAPAGSLIFSLNGAQHRVGEKVDAGVYVVMLPGGKAVKIMIK